MVGNFLSDNSKLFKGAFLLGSFLNRGVISLNDQGLSQVNKITVPVLTVAGELDGLTRIFRIAES